jgi:hypothetical protein
VETLPEAVLCSVVPSKRLVLGEWRCADLRKTSWLEKLWDHNNNWGCFDLIHAILG